MADLTPNFEGLPQNLVAAQGSGLPHAMTDKTGATPAEAVSLWTLQQSACPLRQMQCQLRLAAEFDRQRTGKCDSNFEAGTEDWSSPVVMELSQNLTVV